MNTISAVCSELICTRISHDLIGNIGAVANAVELLEEGDMDFIDDIRSILGASSSVLSARLKFFRMAFGLSNANLEDKNTVKKSVTDYLATVGNRNYPISFELGEYNSKFARVVMICAMLLADIVVKDGKITIVGKDDKVYASVSAEAKLSEQKIGDIATILSGQQKEPLAQYAPVFYLKELCKEFPLSITAMENNNFAFVIG